MPQPMTAAGVASKMTELYALSNTLLYAQADAIEKDFRGWVRTNFSLTTAQNTYLTGINDLAANYYAAQCSVAFRSRLSVTLTVGIEPIPPAKKWIRTESTLETSTDSLGTIVTTGALIFRFEYHA